MCFGIVCWLYLTIEKLCAINAIQFSSALYQITHLGDDDEEPEFTSVMAEQLEEGTTFFFQPRDLKNLVLVDEMESLSPIMHCQVIVGETWMPYTI